MPLTSSTSAWPPSLPSVPTSRATRVTSAAKLRSRSTIVLIVSASWATSPLAATVIFCDRSPFATAVVTCEMFRTWSVRFDAMKFTFSVRSRHVPLTPWTCAWPPSWPSVPTSRATRVTSSAKLESWSTIAFTVVPIRRNSPFTGWPSISSAIFWFRSPSATASITRATSVVGRTRSSISALIDSIDSSHAPPTGPSEARSVMRPSRPITRPIRCSSRFIMALRSASSLNAACSSPTMPLRRVLQADLEVAVAGLAEGLEEVLEQGYVDVAVAVAVQGRRRARVGAHGRRVARALAAAAPAFGRARSGASSRLSPTCRALARPALRLRHRYSFAWVYAFRNAATGTGECSAAGSYST